MINVKFRMVVSPRAIRGAGDILFLRPGGRELNLYEFLNQTYVDYGFVHKPATKRQLYCCLRYLEEEGSTEEKEGKEGQSLEDLAKKR